MCACAYMHDCGRSCVLCVYMCSCGCFRNDFEETKRKIVRPKHLNMKVNNLKQDCFSRSTKLHMLVGLLYIAADITVID